MMHEAGGLSAVGPMRGRSGCLLPCLWGAPWDTPEGMTLVHFPQAPAAHPSAHVPPIGAAVEAFFVHRDLAPNSRRVYRAALDPLVEAVGADQPLAALTPAAVAGVFTDRWGDAAAATWNTRRAAVRAFASWCADPLAARRGPARFGRSPPPAHRPHPSGPLPGSRRVVAPAVVWPLREKTLWRMLYETAARASEVLALDVEDLDRPQRRARVVSKGGNTDMVYWGVAHRAAGRPLPRRPEHRAAVPHHRPLPQSPPPGVTSMPRPARPGSPTAPRLPCSAVTPVGGLCTSCATRR